MNNEDKLKAVMGSISIEYEDYKLLIQATQELRTSRAELVRMAIAEWLRRNGRKG